MTKERTKQSSTPDRPVFEVTARDGRYFAIFADGRVHGDFGDDCIIINRIPQYAREMVHKAKAVA